ncbi:hypothetical protein FVB32_02925 [Flagellimonas hymeniacidonis]|uniref:Uncharacterized protein n=1 Tax=Flagellimonas hymeniacidonis TaxID=2603628 RepID=A0A5C8V7C0_9FLAO|nr:hypothetical protein [Flagellimonas hymeniacidonis]TXN37256.1 hypothetical protein FVB32_02925 [Flagellimonas hymeniacidonis]
MKTKNYLKIALAVISGELLMVLLITLAQEIVVPGVKLGISSTSDIIIGGFGTLLSGTIAGFTATLIGGKTTTLPSILLSILVVLETSYLIFANKILNPVWFDVTAALSLIGAIWVGYYLCANGFFFKKDNISRI